VIWTFTDRARSIHAGERLTIRTNCPGSLTWSVDDGPTREVDLMAVGGVMAGARRHQITLGPFAPSQRIRFRFRCRHDSCDHAHPCCHGEDERVLVE
jgi:hypothetical protein